jgi:plasmid segregation protein ParM
MSFKKAAYDWGYSSLKPMTEYIKDNPEDYLMPAVIGAGYDLSFTMGSKKTIDSIQVKFDGKHFFAGKLAQEQSRLFYNSIKQDRFDDVAFDALVKASLGLTLPDDCDVRIVTGLPPKFYATHKNLLVDALKKTHKFNFNGEDREINVTHVNVLPQLVGTALDLLYDDAGKKTNLDLHGKSFGIIDPGFGTTDIAVFSKGEYKDDMKDSTRNNMSEVYRLVNEELHKQYRIEANDFQLESIVRTGVLSVKGKKYNVAELVSWAKDNVAMAIVNHLNTVWIKQWEIDVVYLTAGGGIALHPYMRKYMPDLQLVPDAQFSNVRGYYKKAIRTW